jgi:uncharacterized glyoxalase superfamily protein PhnB
MTTYPTFRYRDAHAAIDWLTEAFGFTVKEVHDSADGTVGHAELRAGQGIVMLGTAKDDDWGKPGGSSVYVAIDDPDAVHDRAVAAGAEIIRPLQDTDYGSREFSARDPEGNIWSFGTYAP